MLLQFKNKRISSIISVIPANEVNFMDEIGNYSFTETQMKKLKKVMINEESLYTVKLLAIMQ